MAYLYNMLLIQLNPIFIALFNDIISKIIKNESNWGPILLPPGMKLFVP